MLVCSALCGTGMLPHGHEHAVHLLQAHTQQLQPPANGMQTAAVQRKQAQKLAMRAADGFGGSCACQPLLTQVVHAV
jgi:hypothetical protein